MVEAEKILIRMPNWIGDAVMALAAVDDLRRHLAQAEIAAICHEGIAPLLAGLSSIDHIISYSKQGKAPIDSIRRYNPGIGLLFTNSFSSAWWFMRCRIPKRIGFRTHFRGGLLTHAIQPPAEGHLVTTYKQLLAPFDIPISTTAPRLSVSQQELEEARQLLAAHGILPSHIVVGMNPGAAFGEAKCWPLERFEAVSSLLTKDPRVRVIYFGDKAIQPKTAASIVNLAGKTSLRMLIATIRLLHCLVTNDSGPMHIAAAVNTPLVAIFGSTNEIKTGPYTSCAKVLHRHTACSPCYLRKCPIDFRCMTSISPEEVFHTVQHFLKAL